MKRKYVVPTLNLIEFHYSDVITASGGYYVGNRTNPYTPDGDCLWASSTCDKNSFDFC